MHVIPVLFEDHTLVHFRPLAWSQPTYEMRVGMFSLRERAGLLAEPGQPQGILLGRAFLTDLQQAAGWANGPEAAAEMMSAENRVFLWLSGRADWSVQRIGSLLEQAGAGATIDLSDEHGLLAFACGPARSRELLDSWRNWETIAAQRKSWSVPGRPAPVWLPETPPGTPPAEKADALQWIWQIVPRTAAALAEDLAFVRGGGGFSREPFGVLPAQGNDQPVWTLTTSLSRWSPENRPEGQARISVQGPDNFWCGPEVQIGAGVAVNAEAGPVILDRNVAVLPNCYLEGPLYIGPGSIVKPGATIFGESSFGILNRISGEIGESTFGDFANKQHAGFIGHAVLGSWVNLGAMTTCSDLKNNYGQVRVDLGGGAVDTGLKFVGLLLGDHAKTAIGTLFNTGTSVGFATNIFGGAMPPKCVGNFSWGGSGDSPDYDVEQALQTAEVVLARRGCRLTEAHRVLFRTLAAGVPTS